MILLSIRTDKPEAEIGLFDGDTRLGYEIWYAHRQLAETLHLKIRSLLAEHGKELADVQGIICYTGPGSFTGLRIGLSVANALAYGLQIPVTGETGEGWIQAGVQNMHAKNTGAIALPEYGAEVHITLPKH